MKKFVAMLLALVMVFALCACGDKPQNDKQDKAAVKVGFICLHDETVDDSQPLEIFDPQNTWKRKVLTDFTAEELLVPVFRGGELVYSLPTLPEIRARFEAECDGMWEEVRRFTNPHNYYVDLSQKLWDIKQVMLNSRTH